MIGRNRLWRISRRNSRSRINLGNPPAGLAPLLGNDRKRIELLNAAPASSPLPGTPVLYYGDENRAWATIGVSSRRPQTASATPMQWEFGQKTPGSPARNPQSLFLPIILDPEYHYEAVNVENHQHNPHSLLWWTKRMLALRKTAGAGVLALAPIEFLQPDNSQDSPPSCASGEANARWWSCKPFPLCAGGGVEISRRSSNWCRLENVQPECVPAHFWTNPIC